MITSFSQGCGATILRDVPFGMVYFPVYNNLKVSSTFVTLPLSETFPPYVALPHFPLLALLPYSDLSPSASFSSLISPSADPFPFTTLSPSVAPSLF